MQPNPSLTFSRPDAEFIPLPRAPPSASLHALTSDKVAFPEGRHRTLDLFRAAVEMFVDAVRAEYRQQQSNAARNNRAMSRFTWKNDGELAVCFACCCDLLKLLSNKLAPGPQRPRLADLVAQMKAMLMAVSGVPAAILPLKTYDTKHRDWEKGGTRYHSGQSSANVRFPSAQDRFAKIEAYLRSHAGVQMGAIRVHSSAAPPAPAQPPTKIAPTTAAAATAAFIPPLPPPATTARPVAVPPRGPVAVKAAGGHAPKPPVQAAAKQMPEAMRHLYWLSALAHVKGGEPGAAFPPDRLPALPGLVRLCDVTERAAEIATLVAVVSASDVAVQIVFERLGGFVAFRRLFGVLMAQWRAEGADALLSFMDRMARLRPHPWGAASQRAWRRNMEGVETGDLSWLRALPCVPDERRAAWGALVLIFEEKFIFTSPREGADESRKRPRSEQRGDGAGSFPHMDAMRAAAADNVDIHNWRLRRRLYTLGAVRLPVDLRAPPFTTDAERSAVEYLNQKREYAEETQTEWEALLRSMLKASLGPSAAERVKVPLWYEPYELLGMQPDSGEPA